MQASLFFLAGLKSGTFQEHVDKRAITTRITSVNGTVSLEDAELKFLLLGRVFKCYLRSLLINCKGLRSCIIIAKYMATRSILIITII